MKHCLKLGQNVSGFGLLSIEPKNKRILALFFAKESKKRNMFVAERFPAGIIKIHGKHPVSTDGGT